MRQKSIQKQNKTHGMKDEMSFVDFSNAYIGLRRNILHSNKAVQN
jgi:hypothetical protein